MVSVEGAEVEVVVGWFRFFLCILQLWCSRFLGVLWVLLFTEWNGWSFSLWFWGVSKRVRSFTKGFMVIVHVHVLNYDFQWSQVE